ncbi:MAG TPA: hypothetical protein VEK33_11490 [Terriglobales bacterium]|nr:hypothetical protein [Terriglobales bacterium]
MNPRNSTNQVFSVSSFVSPAVGPSVMHRTTCYRGPGINNWDLILFKDTNITELTRLEPQIEFHKFFNHKQFWAGGIVSDINQGGKFRTRIFPTSHWAARLVSWRRSSHF